MLAASRTPRSGSFKAFIAKSKPVSVLLLGRMVDEARQEIATLIPSQKIGSAQSELAAAWEVLVETDRLEGLASRTQ